MIKKIFFANVFDLRKRGRPRLLMDGIIDGMIFYGVMA